MSVPNCTMILLYEFDFEDAEKFPSHSSKFDCDLSAGFRQEEILKKSGPLLLELMEVVSRKAANRNTASIGASSSPFGEGVVLWVEGEAVPRVRPLCGLAVRSGSVPKAQLSARCLHRPTPDCPGQSGPRNLRCGEARGSASSTEIVGSRSTGTEVLVVDL